MKYFIDWAREKQIAIADERGDTKEVAVEDFKIRKGSEVYIEAGFSSRLMYKLIDEGCDVYRIDTHKAHELRKGEKTTDVADALLLRDIYLECPELFTEVRKPTKLEWKLRRLGTMYRQVTRDIARFKNIQQGLKWEHGTDAYDDAISRLEKEKESIFQQMEPLIEHELRRVRAFVNIKGTGGPYLLARLLVSAHPRDFPTWSRYRAYCGCTESTFWKTYDKEKGKGSGRGRFNRDAKSAIYLISTQILKAKDMKLYPLYEDIKVRFQKEHPELKGGCHGKALNRIQTLALKEIYECLKNEPSLKALDEVFVQEREA